MSVRSPIFLLLLLGVAFCLAGCQAEDPNMGKPIVLGSKTPPLSVSPLMTRAQPTPVPPSLPELDKESTLTGREVGQAEVELPKLLGELWYPDSKLSLHSERGTGHVGTWPKVTLLAPDDEKIQGVLDYYELRFPGGERKNGEYVAEGKRVGDGSLARIHIYRAKSGFASGQIVIRIQS
jgi:hypothetical protein